MASTHVVLVAGDPGSVGALECVSSWTFPQGVASQSCRWGDGDVNNLGTLCGSGVSHVVAKGSEDPTHCPRGNAG